MVLRYFFRVAEFRRENVKLRIWITGAMCVALLGGAEAARVTLKSGRSIPDVTVISRAESKSGKTVVTLIRELNVRPLQFYLDDVGSIESATYEVWILKAPASIREASGPEAKVVESFTPGIELRLSKTIEDWAYVIPTAPGLVKDKGWIPKDKLVKELDLRKVMVPQSDAGPALLTQDPVKGNVPLEPSLAFPSTSPGDATQP